MIARLVPALVVVLVLAGCVTHPAEIETEHTDDTSLSATEQLAATIAERPEPNTPEYEELVASFSIDASVYTTPEAVVDAYGDSVFGIWSKAMDEVPSTYYMENLGLSIDEQVDNFQLDYWAEVFSVSILGKPSAELSGDQLTIYNAFVDGLVGYVKQRTLTASEDKPTNITPLEESTIITHSQPGIVEGFYNYTIQPNAQNSLTGQANESSPLTGDIGGRFAQSPDIDVWNLIAIVKK